MQFAFDDRQLEFRTQLRALADKLCTPSDLRASWDSAHGWSRQRWQALADLGVTGLTVPEEHGGLGLGQVDLVLLLEEAGRAGLPEPLLDTVAVGAPLLAAVGTWPGAADWLAKVAGGEAVLAVAEPTRPLVVTAGADLLLVWRDDALLALPADLARVSVRRSIDGARRLWELEEPGDGAEVLASGEEATRLRQLAADRGAAAAAAVLVGVAERLITMAAGYAKERTQFGRAIGSFQAVKHHLADAFVRLEFARPLVYRAAWSIDEGQADASRHASMAKAGASDAASLAARVALQVHGAIGYTWEHDLHLWMKRAWALAAAWGDAGTHRASVLGLFAG